MIGKLADKKKPKSMQRLVINKALILAKALALVKTLALIKDTRAVELSRLNFA